MSPAKQESFFGPDERIPTSCTARSVPTPFDSDHVAKLFAEASEERVRALSEKLKDSIGVNLPKTIARKKTLQDYKTNPYALMAHSSVMNLQSVDGLAQFLVDIKLYTGLETSFGKSIEGVVMGAYPLDAEPDQLWEDPQEKLAEFAAIEGLSGEARSRARTNSVWRIIDRSCVYKGTRYLTSMKSGPNTINDDQVSAMERAVRDNYRKWLAESQENYGVESVDVIIGLTYGTPKTTNNKDCQLIYKLLDAGFDWEGGDDKSGVLVDNETGRVRVYRLVGMDFWSLVARPDDPSSAQFAFLEVLLALADALREVSQGRSVEERLNERLQMLGDAIKGLKFSRGSLPGWVRDEFSEGELVWLASAMTTFFDEGL